MRYLVKISYDGKNYCGWQRQNKGVSIQQTLEESMQKVLGENINLFASGRTDAGVSAVCQTAHFDYSGVLPKNFVGHINWLLPDDIRLLEVSGLADDFHARYDVKRKTYKYFFYLSKESIPFYDRFATQIKSRVDMTKFEKAMLDLMGTHDFTSFCATNTEVVDKTRTIYDVSVEGDGKLFEFSITGSGFLYNMVRIIVGTLVDIASGKIDGSVCDIIECRDRARAGKTLSGKGLTLYEVKY